MYSAIWMLGAMTNRQHPAFDSVIKYNCAFRYLWPKLDAFPATSARGKRGGSSWPNFGSRKAGRGQRLQSASGVGTQPNESRGDLALSRPHTSEAPVICWGAQPIDEL
jgi:hypothetical protein